MKKNINLSNSVTLVILVIIVSIVAYAAYEKPKRVNAVNKRIIAEKVTKPASSILRDSIVNFGMEFLGTPYVAAGCGKDGFDCSGFVFFVFKHFNIEVPRSSVDFDHFGTEIPIANVEKGDLLLFLSPTRNVIGHIGIVSNPKGAESDFIHASSGREMKVIVSSLASKGYTSRFVKAVRVW